MGILETSLNHVTHAAYTLCSNGVMTIGSTDYYYSQDFSTLGFFGHTDNWFLKEKKKKKRIRGWTWT